MYLDIRHLSLSSWGEEFHSMMCLDVVISTLWICSLSFLLVAKAHLLDHPTASGGEEERETFSSS